MKVFIRIMSVLAVMAVAGCGGGTPATVKIAFLYAIGQGTNAVLGFAAQNDGELESLSVSQFATNPIPVAIIPTPNKNFVYVANSTSNTVTGFTFNHGSGVLTPIGNAIPPTSVGTTPVSLGVDPASQFLYVLNQGSSNILSFSIDPVRGLLTPFGLPVSVPANPQFLVVAPNAGFLYVSAGPQILGFTINSDGSLSAIPGSPFTGGTSIRGMAVDPGGKFLYAADSGANQVAIFNIGSNGALSTVSGSPFNAGTNPVMVAVDSTGSFLYTVNTGSNDASAFKISSGSLTPIINSPYSTAGSGVTTATQPAYVVVDTTNQFVYIANQGSRDIMAFLINKGDGSLSAVTNSPFSQVIGPTALLSIK